MPKVSPDELTERIEKEFAAQKAPVPSDATVGAIAIASAGYLRRSSGVWPLPDDYLEAGLIQTFVSAYLSRPTPDYWTLGTMPAIIRSGLSQRPVPFDDEAVDALARIAVGLLRSQGHKVLPAGSAVSYVGRSVFECYVAGQP